MFIQYNHNKHAFIIIELKGKQAQSTQIKISQCEDAYWVSCNGRTCNANLLNSKFKFDLNVTKLNRCMSTPVELQVANAKCSHRKWIKRGKI